MPFLTTTRATDTRDMAAKICTTKVRASNAERDRSILAMLAEGATRSEVATQFGLTLARICQIAGPRHRPPEQAGFADTIISRREAIAAGLPEFFTGIPCLRGHITKRPVSGRRCPVCQREIHTKKFMAGRGDRTKEMAQTVARTQVARKAQRQERFPDREIVTRPEAKELGLKRYFTGRPCKHGHFAERRTSDGVCMGCPQIRGKPENIKKNRRRHYERHKAAYFAAASRRRAAKRNPPWADRKAIQAIYAACPPAHHVDHIVPLKGKFVSGLHVPWNLQYLTGADNLQKGNSFDP